MPSPTGILKKQKAYGHIEKQGGHLERQACWKGWMTEKRASTFLFFQKSEDTKRFYFFTLPYIVRRDFNVHELIETLFLCVKT